MKELIKVIKIEVETNQKKLFEGNNLSVSQGDIIGVIGKNGSGKTTLFDIISQNPLALEVNQQIHFFIAPDEIAYMKQEEETFELKEPSHTPLSRKWETGKDYQLASGGEKIKQRLIAAFGEGPKLLLLDEPTNHLDDESTEQLIETIKQFNGTILLISHDRYLLNQVATKIWAIEDEKISAYSGNYDQYLQIKKHREETQAKAYDKQQKEVKKIKQEMKRFSDMASSAHAQSTKREGYKEYYRAAAKRMDKQRKSAEKRLTKELSEKKVERVKTAAHVVVDVKESKKASGPVFIAKQLTKRFGHQVLFSDVSFTINSREKVAITGKNGSGKSTLLKILLGNESFTGALWESPSNQIGYLSQEVYDLPMKETVRDYLGVEAEQRTLMTTMFIQLGFQATQMNQPIESLSMGERVKLKLMGHIIKEKNILILDEPTNHLDIATREALEEVLQHYKGTIILVSHDRYFREKVAERSYNLADGRLNVPVMKKPAEEKRELSLLELEKTRLLSELSILSIGSDEYNEVDRKFQEVLRKIKALKN